MNRARDRRAFGGMEMEKLKIPFNRPTAIGREFDHIADALDRGHISGDGAYTSRCQALLEEELQVPRVLLTTSCTHALEMAALLLEIEPGDEVIVPSFSFVTTVNSFVLRGARPVFADIRPDTLNLDESCLESLIGPRTRAIVLVHYAGVACEMDSILDIAQAAGLAVVEDNAHGLFGKYKDKYLGTFGALATQSFHETKNFTCGEGGALLINQPGLVERAEIIREKGTDRSKFFRGEVDRYTWVDLGSSYLPSDLLAAFLYAQLERRREVEARRKSIWHTYARDLRDWADGQNVTLPSVPDCCQQTYHMFYCLLPSFAARQAFISHMKERGILSVFHYLPLHLSPMGRRFGGRQGDSPVTEDISDRLVRLPFFFSISDTEVSQVLSAVREFRTT